MLLKIENLYKTYSKGTEFECQALKNVNISVEEGDMLAIVGKSGSGKSTLLQIIGLLDDFDKGDYYFEGRSVSAMNNKQTSKLRNLNIGFVLQDFALIPDMTVFDNVAIPLLLKGEKAAVIDALVNKLLYDLDIYDKAKTYTNMLSGGQKQRVAIARALVCDPKLILADEPTGALDSRTASDMIDILLELNRRGKTIIIVTHDMQLAQRCKRRIEISDGMIVDEE